MKFCTNCGNENPDTSGFCKSCGAQLQATTNNQNTQTSQANPNQPNPTNEILNKTGDFLRTGGERAREVATTGAKMAQQLASDGATMVQEKQQQRQQQREADAQYMQDMQNNSGNNNYNRNNHNNNYSSRGSGEKHSMFISPTEVTVASIGSGFLQNVLTSGGVSKGSGILTQNRFYYKGTNFQAIGKSLKNSKEEGVVSLEDITFTRFVYTHNIGALIFAVMIFLLGSIFAIGEEESSYFFAALFPAIFFAMSYFISRKNLFLVAFPGGGFAFNATWYPVSEIREFQRQLHLLKDQLKYESK